MKRIEITTDDGVCPTFVFGETSQPNVLMFMDGVGMRPALHAIADRIASAGFYVMLPDLFYRLGPYTAPEPAKLFGDPAVRAAWFVKLKEVANTEFAVRDTRVFLTHLPAAKIGTTGYCMGGRFSMSAAAAFSGSDRCRGGVPPGQPRERRARQPAPRRVVDQGARLHRCGE